MLRVAWKLLIYGYFRNLNIYNITCRAIITTGLLSYLNQLCLHKRAILSKSDAPFIERAKTNSNKCVNDLTGNRRVFPFIDK